MGQGRPPFPVHRRRRLRLSPSATALGCWPPNGLSVISSSGRVRSAALAAGGKKPPRAVAQFGRAPVSKTGGWGFESLLPC